MSDTPKPAIVVDKITKSFRIPLEGRTGLKQKILGVFRKSKGYRKFTPLNKVSFQIEKGEFFGIVGRNGSGKSTLLKTIAGIYSADSGSINVSGLLVPFIELGVGFNPELTGRENVFLNGALLGFSRKEISQMYDEIVDFAELHDFMGEQLKNYSSGMQVRLAFSIAVRARGDILLLDEVLAVGDTAFQQKCYDYFDQLKSENRTIVLVTHSMDTVKRFCTRALLLENGKIKSIGSPAEIADQYTVDNIAPSHSVDSQTGTNILDSLKGSINSEEFTRSDSLKIKVKYRLSKDSDIMLGVAIVKDGKSIAELNSLDTTLPSRANVWHTAKLDVDLKGFVQGVYSINLAAFAKEGMTMIEMRKNVATFVIKGNDQTRGGSVYIKGPWTVD